MAAGPSPTPSSIADGKALVRRYLEDVFSGGNLAAMDEYLAGEKFKQVDEFVFCVDAVTQYAGALGSQPGVVVAAGTGVIALAIGPTGAIVRSDGWGYILGDEGETLAPLSGCANRHFSFEAREREAVNYRLGAEPFDRPQP